MKKTDWALRIMRGPQAGRLNHNGIPITREELDQRPYIKDGEYIVLYPIWDLEKWKREKTKTKELFRT